MDQEPMKIRQEIHDKGRRQLILGRRAQEITDPTELKSLRMEQATLTREITALKKVIARTQS